MVATAPPADFARAELQIHTVWASERFGRIHASRYPDPLGYGKAPSRFSDPRRRKDEGRFGVLYLGETLVTCFLEAILRDRRNGMVGDLLLSESELAQRIYAELEIAAPLHLVDLRDNKAIVMGVPSAVHRGTRHGLGRNWSVAFHEHPEAPDGIIYPSRLNGRVCLAIYNRALPKLRPGRLRRLIDVEELASILTELRVALVSQ